MIIAASFILCLTIVFLGAQLLGISTTGMPQQELPLTMDAIIAPLLCALTIFLGIISSILFDRFDKRFNTKGKIFKKTDLLVASILSPLVFLSFYPLMEGTKGIALQILLAYQNGFLFQNIISRVRAGQNDS